MSAVNVKLATQATLSTAPPLWLQQSPRTNMRIVTSVEMLQSALAERDIIRIRLSASGSPYRLGAQPLHIDRNVIVEGEHAGSSSTDGMTQFSVVLIGSVVLSAGTLQALEVRPGKFSSLIHASARGAAPQAAVTVQLVASLDASLSATLQNARIIAPAAISLALMRPSSSASARPFSARAPGCSSARGSAVPAASAPPPLAVRIAEGVSGRVALCELVGGVSICTRASPLLQSNTIRAAVGAGIELRGTSLSCEVRDNTISESGGAGLVMCARAAATIADNRVRGCVGAGMEVFGACHDILISRNEIADSGGVGLLLRDGANGKVAENVVRRAGSSSLEVCGRGSSPLRVINNTLTEGKSNASGVLLTDGTDAHLQGNHVSCHPLDGVEIAAGACPTLTENVVTKCGGAGVLIGANGGGELRGNTISENMRHGVECCSNHPSLLLERNTITGHRRGSGVLVRGGGGGRWVDNVISMNLHGVELVEEATPELVRNRIHANLREGLTIGSGVVASVVECNVRANGNARITGAYQGGRRGQHISGDDAGAGVVVHAGGVARMHGNQIAMNAGAGIFTHTDAKTTLTSNTFRGNKGEALAARPRAETTLAEADAKSLDPTRAVTPVVMRRQRTPFDWTVGSNVTAEDKSLAERAAEYRAQFEAMRGSDKMASGVAMLPPGADATAVCALQ